METSPYLPTLQAGRLRLRGLHEQDLPDLFAVFSNAEVCRYWSRPAMTKMQEAEALLADIQTRFASHSLYQWGVALGEHDRVIGTCTLADIDRQNRRAEVGFALQRGYWGRGLMHEAVQRLIQHAFGPMDLRRLEADIDPRNLAARKLCERNGFVHEGTLRERWLVAGEICDAVLYGLLRKDLQQVC